MKTKLVTCIYTAESGAPFYLHGTTGRYDRYTHSLALISNTGLPIVCYCSDDIIDKVKQDVKDGLVKFGYEGNTNIEFKVSNLSDYKYVSEFSDIRKENPNKFKHYLEMGNNKLFLLEKELDSNYDYIYWIDAGLSHKGLWPPKWNANPTARAGMSHDKNYYNFPSVFNNKLFADINKWIGDKLLNISNGQRFHSVELLNNALEEETKYYGLSIGGIFGGHVSKINYLLDTFDKYLNVAIKNKILLNHEAIISAVYESKREFFKTYYFNTWYHEESHTYGLPKLNDPEYWKDKISFYNFINEIRK